MNRKRLLVAIGALAVAATAAVEARPPFMQGGDLDIATVEQKAAERFTSADTDKDGKVSLAEFLAQREERSPGDGPRFHHFRDGPGGMGGPGRPGHGHPPMAMESQAMEDAVFKQLDANGNGAISRDEFTHEKLREAHGTVMRTAVFDKLDANGDGFISDDERPSPAEHLRALDTNGDGKVSREERQAAHKNGGGWRGQQDG
ncbi:MAG: EF-hand domain-containing protein [Pseudomonadales bacterium]|nr:EF-hand domain-containing protein [Pseudomonadales bacterium]MCP5184287.1 EF-hand domain-containing protein [Pseudomonadales bacterium]